MKWISESFTKRAVLVAMIAGGGALSAGAFAVAPAANPGKTDCTAMHGKHGHKNQAERMEQRTQHLAALKTKLNLTAQQEAAWNAFTASRKGSMNTMGDRKAMRAEFTKLTTPQRMDKMLEMADKRRSTMVERAQATKGFYAQLTPAQQAVFDAEAKFKGHGHRGHHQKS